METKKDIKYTRINSKEIYYDFYNQFNDEDEDEDEHRNGCFPRKETIVIFVRELLKINPKII